MFLINKKNCVYREKIDSENLVVLVLINSICYSQNKKIKKTPTYRKQEGKSACVNIFSELMLTDKLRHHTQINATSYY